jgi:hypothetical protein
MYPGVAVEPETEMDATLRVDVFAVVEYIKGIVTVS